MDVRFDDKALGILTSRSKAEYAAALREYLTAVYADRNKVGAGMDKDAVRAQVDDKWGSEITKMAEKFESRAKAYRLITDAERLIPTTLAGKRFVSYPMGVRFSVERDAAKTYESAAIDSTAHDRSLAASRMFDDLMKEADHINAPLFDEHTAAYPLVALVPVENLELAMGRPRRREEHLLGEARALPEGRLRQHRRRREGRRGLHHPRRHVRPRRHPQG